MRRLCTLAILALFGSLLAVATASPAAADHTTVTWKGVTWNVYGVGGADATATVDPMTDDLTLTRDGPGEVGLEMDQIPGLVGEATPWVEFAYVDDGTSMQGFDLFIDNPAEPGSPRHSAGSLFTSCEGIGYERFTDAGVATEEVVFTEPDGCVAPGRPAGVEHTIRIGKRADGTIDHIFDGVASSSTFLVDNGFTAAQIDFEQVLLRWRDTGGAANDTALFTDLSFGDDHIAPAQLDTVFVDGASTAATPNGTEDSPFPTIHEGVDAVNDGGTVIVQPGTTTEDEQTVVDKDVTIVGEDDATTTALLTFDTGNGRNNPASGWIRVTDTGTLDLSGLTLDGNGQAVSEGIRAESDTTVTDSILTDMKFGTYGGVAIAARGSDDGAGSSVLTVDGVSFSEIGRISVHPSGDNASASHSVITNNTHVGKGTGDHLDYFIDLGRGANDVLISGNTVSGNRGVAASDGSTSAAILVTDFFTPTTSAALIVGNTFTDNTTGIAVGFATDDTSDVTANFNRIVGNDSGIVSTNSAVDAENNWWGCNDGPGAAGCDPVTGDVDADPWLVLGISADPTTVAIDQESAITADLLSNSDGESAAGGFPDGGDVAFATSIGQVDPTSASLTDGEAATTFSSSTAGVADVSASFDAETVTTQVTVQAPPPPCRLIRIFVNLGFLGLSSFVICI